jgi:hypothetical protein
MNQGIHSTKGILFFNLITVTILSIFQNSENLFTRKTKISSLILHGCKTDLPALREEQKLKCCETKELKIYLYLRRVE